MGFHRDTYNCAFCKLTDSSFETLGCSHSINKTVSMLHIIIVEIRKFL